MRTIGSLFAGIGGFDIGFQRTGFKTIWNCEIDKNCQKLLAARFPEAAQHFDVTRFRHSSFECPTVITFGSPCQDLSVAGQRKGLDGERSGLFYEAARIIRGFVSRGLEFAVWENVPGSLSSNGGRDFAAVLGALGKCWALDIGWRILDAQWFGLAQRRKRVFLVADFRGKRVAEILSLAQSLCGDTAPSRETGKRIAPTIEGHAGRSGANNFATSGGLLEVCGTIQSRERGGGFGTDFEATGGLQVVVPPIAGVSNGGGANGPGRTVDDCESLIVVALQEVGKRQSGTPMNGVGYSQPGDPMFTLQANAQHGICATLTKNYATHHGRTAGNNGGIAENQLIAAFKPNQGAKSRSIGYSEDVSPTCESAQGGNNKPALLHGSSVRRLTPTECLRLQGFPDTWLDDLNFSDSVKYRMIGNAVAVPCAEWIAKRMAKVL